MPNKSLLPIKVIFPSGDDFSARPSGGGDPKMFADVTPELREQLVGQVSTVRSHFEQSFSRYPDLPAVAHVTLRESASAKSHRPRAIFNDATCPVIGVNDLGQLLISVTRRGLDRVKERINTSTAEQARANISSLKEIEPWTERDSLRGHESNEILRSAPRQARRAIRCRLFRHRTEPANEALRRAFLDTIKKLDIGEPEELRYSDSAIVFALPELSAEALDKVAQFAGTQSLSRFPDFRIVRSTSRVLGTISADRLPPPEEGIAYPLAGIIDSGTDPNNPILQAWVHDRYDWIPRSQQRNDHGSFVAGLLAGGRALNNGSPQFPGTSSRIVDVVALDNTGSIIEYDLVTVIDEAIRRYPEVKVWNLSLGLDDCCDEREFSYLATVLDDRSREHGVIFIVAAGNYDRPRSWPPPSGLTDDRICPPADSVRSITVGSVAHLDSAATCVRSGEPSPFSRRGPAPAYLLAPDLTHYGGNCDEQGAYLQTGVVSVDGSGHIAEDIGTSLSTPLVTTMIAGVWHELDVEPGAVSPLLAKALLLHSAFLRGAPTDYHEANYHGLGVPAEPPDVVACTQSAATVILQIPVALGPVFEKRPFPMPTCLVRDSRLRAEVFMTLLHDAPLDANYGMEYCRSNVNATLGTMRYNERKGKEECVPQIFAVPKFVAVGFEKDVVKYGYKWSPLKLYYRKFTRGPADQEWRLRLTRLDRAEYDDPRQQDVYLIVTVRDLAGEAHVYDEMVQAMNGLGWVTQDLRVQSRARLRS